MFKLLSEPAYSLQLDLHWGSLFASRLRTRVLSVPFSSVNWILSGSWSRHRVTFSKLISEPACSSQVDLLTLSQSSPPVSNATYLRTFFKVYLCFSRDFFKQHVFLLLDLHWDSPKLPWGMQRICGPCFWRLSFCLSRDSLSCDTRSLDVCFLFKFIFLYL